MQMVVMTAPAGGCYGAGFKLSNPIENLKT